MPRDTKTVWDWEDDQNHCFYVFKLLFFSPVSCEFLDSSLRSFKRWTRQSGTGFHVLENRNHQVLSESEESLVNRELTFMRMILNYLVFKDRVR